MILALIVSQIYKELFNAYIFFQNVNCSGMDIKFCFKFNYKK